jgi:hypothetical protein
VKAVEVEKLCTTTATTEAVAFKMETTTEVLATTATATTGHQWRPWRRWRPWRPWRYKEGKGEGHRGTFATYVYTWPSRTVPVWIEAKFSYNARKTWTDFGEMPETIPPRISAKVR